MTSPFNDFLLSVSEPKRAFRLSVYFLLFWFVAGLADHFMFQSQAFSCQIFSSSETFSPPLSTWNTWELRWINDYLGHWATVFAVIAIVLNRFWNVFLSAESSPDITHEFNKDFRKISFVWGTGLLFLCLIMAFANGHFVSSSSEPVHWQAQICNPVLPYLTAFWFYVIVMFPLLMCYLKVLTKLRAICQNCTKATSFNVADPNGMYGLERIGSLINAFLSISLLASFPMLMIQLTTKDSITFGNLIGFIIIGFILYHAVLSPILLLNKNLQDVRQKFLSETQTQWQDLQTQINQLPLKDTSEAEVNLLELKHKVLIQKLDLCKRMKWIPLTIKSKVLAVFSALPSGVTVVVTLLEFSKTAS